MSDIHSNNPAGKIGQALAAQVGDARVVLAMDTNHFRMDEIIAPFLHPDFWKAMQAKGFTALGVEYLNPGHQPILDAFMTGQITRDEFLDIFQAPRHENGARQMTAAQSADVMKGVANLIEHGIAVYGTNNMAGGATNGDIHIALELEASDQSLSYIAFRRTHAEALRTDPHGFLNEILQKQQNDRQNPLSEGQKDDIASPLMNVFGSFIAM
jgi:hypothetical protein